jgi:hypothetical protein
MGPLLITFFYIDSRVLKPFVACSFAPAQVESPVNDLPSLWIHTGKLASRHSRGSETAVLRNVGLRVGHELVPIRGTRKTPLGVLPLILEFLFAFHGLPLSEIGDGVIPFYGNTEGIGINLVLGAASLDLGWQSLGEKEDRSNAQDCQLDCPVSGIFHGKPPPEKSPFP